MQGVYMSLTYSLTSNYCSLLINRYTCWQSGNYCTVLLVPNDLHVIPRTPRLRKRHPLVRPVLRNVCWKTLRGLGFRAWVRACSFGPRVSGLGFWVLMQSEDGLQICRRIRSVAYRRAVAVPTPLKPQKMINSSVFRTFAEQLPFPQSSTASTQAMGLGIQVPGSE